MPCLWQKCVELLWWLQTKKIQKDAKLEIRIIIDIGIGIQMTLDGE